VDPLYFCPDTNNIRGRKKKKGSNLIIQRVQCFKLQERRVAHVMQDDYELELLYSIKFNYEELSRIISLISTQDVENISYLDLAILHKIECAYRSVYML
jgi:hypothetical protein